MNNLLFKTVKITFKILYHTFAIIVFVMGLSYLLIYNPYIGWAIFASIAIAYLTFMALLKNSALNESKNKKRRK